MLYIGLNNINNRYTGIKVKNEIATVVSDDIFVINKNYTVKKIDVKKIDVGSNHAYIIDNNNDIYSFGDNTYKQLGLYDTIEYKSGYYIENINIELYNNNNEYIDWIQENNNYIPLNENGMQLYINNNCDKYVLTFEYSILSNINDYKIILMNDLNSIELFEFIFDNSNIIII